MRRYDGTNVGGDDVINLPVDYGAEHKAPLKGKRVLIVEDEYFQADELMRAIQAAGGLVVGPFAQTSEAAEALTENVGLAVLDVWVRDGATYPLATQLRERGIPFVFATDQGQMARERGQLTIASQAQCDDASATYDRLTIFFYN